MNPTSNPAPGSQTVPAARYTLASHIECRDVEMIPDPCGEYGEYQARAVSAALSAYQTRTDPQSW